MLPTEMISHWRFRVHRMQLGHYTAARKFEASHLWLGLPAIIFSSIVGTTVFASLANGANMYLQVITGLLSVTAAVLTALQTFLKHSELAEKHRIAGAKFANLKHRIELLITMSTTEPNDLKQQLSLLEELWSKVREESPTIPTTVWKKVESSLTYEEHQRRYPML